MRQVHYVASWTLALFLGLSLAAVAEDRPTWSIGIDSDPVVRSEGTVVSVADLDAHLSAMPEEDRSQFVSSRERLGDAIERILLRRLGAKTVSDRELPDEPVAMAKAMAALEDELFEQVKRAYLDQHLLDDYREPARELWLTERERFVAPTRYSFSHVLIRTADREEAEAMRRVLDLHDRVREGADFDELIAEFNEDRANEERPGYYREVAAGNLDRNFARALADLSESEQVSGPVRSRFGWHLIRLDEKHPGGELSWEEAEDEARKLARQRHRERLLQRYYAELVNFDEVEIVPGAIEAFQRRYGYDPQTQAEASD